ncbi:transcription factor TGA9 isoform X1, partial [Tanacetum coccineum]
MYANGSQRRGVRMWLMMETHWEKGFVGLLFGQIAKVKILDRGISLCCERSSNFSSSLFKRHLQMQRVFNRVEWSRLKVVAAKTVVFHLITSMWGTPSESYFLWMRGFCPSDLMKMLAIQLHLLTEQQVVGIYSLQHSSQQAEEALSQGLDQLH